MINNPLLPNNDKISNPNKYTLNNKKFDDIHTAIEEYPSRVFDIMHVNT